MGFVGLEIKTSRLIIGENSTSFTVFNTRQLCELACWELFDSSNSRRAVCWRARSLVAVYCTGYLEAALCFTGIGVDVESAGREKARCDVPGVNLCRHSSPQVGLVAQRRLCAPHPAMSCTLQPESLYTIQWFLEHHITAAPSVTQKWQAVSQLSQRL